MNVDDDYDDDFIDL